MEYKQEEKLCVFIKLLFYLNWLFVKFLKITIRFYTTYTAINILEF